MKMRDMSSSSENLLNNVSSTPTTSKKPHPGLFLTTKGRQSVMKAGRDRRKSRKNLVNGSMFKFLDDMENIDDQGFPVLTRKASGSKDKNDNEEELSVAPPEVFKQDLEKRARRNSKTFQKLKKTPQKMDPPTSASPPKKGTPEVADKNKGRGKKKKRPKKAAAVSARKEGEALATTAALRMDTSTTTTATKPVTTKPLDTPKAPPAAPPEPLSLYSPNPTAKKKTKVERKRRSSLLNKKNNADANVDEEEKKKLQKERAKAARQHLDNSLHSNSSNNPIKNNQEKAPIAPRKGKKRVDQAIPKATANGTTPGSAQTAKMDTAPPPPVVTAASTVTKSTVTKSPKTPTAVRKLKMNFEKNTPVPTTPSTPATTTTTTTALTSNTTTSSSSAPMVVQMDTSSSPPFPPPPPVAPVTTTESSTRKTKMTTTKPSVSPTTPTTTRRSSATTGSKKGTATSAPAPHVPPAFATHKSPRTTTATVKSTVRKTTTKPTKAPATDAVVKMDTTTSTSPPLPPAFATKAAKSTSKTVKPAAPTSPTKAAKSAMKPAMKLSIPRGPALKLTTTTKPTKNSSLSSKPTMDDARMRKDRETQLKKQRDARRKEIRESLAGISFQMKEKKKQKEQQQQKSILKTSKGPTTTKKELPPTTPKKKDSRLARMRHRPKPPPPLMSKDQKPQVPTRRTSSQNIHDQVLKMPKRQPSAITKVEDVQEQFERTSFHKEEETTEKAGPINDTTVEKRDQENTSVDDVTAAQNPEQQAEERRRAAREKLAGVSFKLEQQAEEQEYYKALAAKQQKEKQEQRERQAEKEKEEAKETQEKALELVAQAEEDIPTMGDKDETNDEAMSTTPKGKKESASASMHAVDKKEQKEMVTVKTTPTSTTETAEEEEEEELVKMSEGAAQAVSTAESEKETNENSDSSIEMIPLNDEEEYDDKPTTAKAPSNFPPPPSPKVEIEKPRPAPRTPRGSGINKFLQNYLSATEDKKPKQRESHLSSMAVAANIVGAMSDDISKDDTDLIPTIQEGEGDEDDDKSDDVAMPEESTNNQSTKSDDLQQAKQQDPISSRVAAARKSLTEELMGDQMALSSPRQQKPPLSPSRKRRSSSLRPKTDLSGFLSHLAVLNDLKDLIASPEPERKAAVVLDSDDPNKKSPPGRTRFQQMFQVKCNLMKHLDDLDKEDSPERRMLENHFGLEAEDVDFIQEHIQLCQEENTDIRWDLIETMLFPETGIDETSLLQQDNSLYDGSYHTRSIGVENSVHARSVGVDNTAHNKSLGFDGSFHNRSTNFDGSYHKRSIDTPHSHHARSNSNNNVMLAPELSQRPSRTTGYGATISVESGNGDSNNFGAEPENSMDLDFYSMDDSAITMEYDEDSLVRREEFQEVILELFEIAEATMDGLTQDEIQERRQVLVQLLQATSEEEHYLSTLALDDVSEIVHHVIICEETEAPVQWEMIRDIVFPLGVGNEQMPERTSTSSERRHSKQQEANYANYEEDDSYDDDSLARDESFRLLFDISQAELDVVLNHINICKETEEAIRWDLIGEILFPGDHVRQAMLSNGSTDMDLLALSAHNEMSDAEMDDETPEHSGERHKVHKRLSGGLSGLEGLGDDDCPQRERERAVLSLSSHDELVMSQNSLVMDDNDDGDEGDGDDVASETEYYYDEVSYTERSMEPEYTEHTFDDDEMLLG